MFLLILFAAAMTTMIIYFTFHNVSINTTYRIRQSGGVSYFTFHNVSINTSSGTSGQSKKESLHSTMFLLILFAAAMTTMIIYFTFHNVSINTTYRIRQSGGVSYFTFHNVSINTASREISNVPFGLYIPQCFY